VIIKSLSGNPFLVSKRHCLEMLNILKIDPNFKSMEAGPIWFLFKDGLKTSLWLLIIFLISLSEKIIFF
jgi:hypothetical protein